MRGRKFYKITFFILLGRLTVSANLVLSQLDSVRRLYRSRITRFLDFWGTLRSNPPESAKLLGNPPEWKFSTRPSEEVRTTPTENLACFNIF